MDLSALDNPIMEEEVWETIKSMPSDRAPGPDLVYWQILQGMLAGN